MVVWSLEKLRLVQEGSFPFFWLIENNRAEGWEVICSILLNHRKPSAFCSADEELGAVKEHLHARGYYPAHSSVLFPRPALLTFSSSFSVRFMREGKEPPNLQKHLLFLKTRAYCGPFQCKQMQKLGILHLHSEWCIHGMSQLVSLARDFWS